jgi:hypothetical protein
MRMINFNMGELSKRLQDLEMPHLFAFASQTFVSFEVTFINMPTKKDTGFFDSQLPSHLHHEALDLSILRRHAAGASSCSFFHDP